MKTFDAVADPPVGVVVAASTSSVGAVMTGDVATDRSPCGDARAAAERDDERVARISLSICYSKR